MFCHLVIKTQVPTGRLRRAIGGCNRLSVEFLPPQSQGVDIMAIADEL